MEKRSNIEEEEIQTIIPTWGLCCNAQKEEARFFFILIFNQKGKPSSSAQVTAHATLIQHETKKNSWPFIITRKNCTTSGRGAKEEEEQTFFLFLVRAHVPTRHLHALSWLKKIFPTEIGQGRSRRAHTTGSEINKKIRATMSAGGQTPERVTTHKPTRERNMEKHMSNEAIPVPGLYISWIVHTLTYGEDSDK